MEMKIRPCQIPGTEYGLHEEKKNSVIDFFFYFIPSRVDADCISPDVKNSIHVGDKILEINGTPIHHVPLDEVPGTSGHGTTGEHAYCQNY